MAFDLHLGRPNIERTTMQPTFRPSKFLYLLSGFIFLVGLVAVPAHAENTNLELSTHEGLLGSAYQSEKEEMVGQSCLKFEKSTPAGKATGGFTFQSSMSESQISSELGFGIGAHLRYGVVKAGADTSFLTNSMSNQLSVSAIWESSYVFPVDKLQVTVSDLNETGKAVLGTSHWATTCGDHFVDEVVRGAKLFFSVRVDFQSLEDTKRFDAKFSLEGPLGDVSASLKEASSSFSRSTKVIVSAYQMGGDVSKVTGIFGQGESGRKGFVQCQLGDFDRCAEVISSALKYATDTRDGFPSQLAQGILPGPAMLSYRTSPYEAIGIYIKNYPALEEATKIARVRLGREFEKQFAYSVITNRLLYQKNLGERKPKIEAERTKVDANVSKLLEVADVCYLTPNDCHARVSKVLDPDQATGLAEIVPIDETLFLPETFEQLCEMSKSSVAIKNTFIRVANSLKLPHAGCPEMKQALTMIQKVAITGEGMNDSLDLRVLAPFRNIEELSVTHSKLTDISAVAQLTNLRNLDLSDNHISDVEPISDLVDLMELDLSRNLISEVGPISGLLRLQRLFLMNNRIASLASLQFLPQAISIDLRLNPLSKKEVDGFKSRMSNIVDIKW